MNWILHTNSNANWKIESNGLPDYDDGTDNGILAYRWEKTFVRIIMKTAGQKTITVDNVDYILFDANEVVIVEITDFVRSFASGSIIFGSESFSYTLNFTAIAGERQTENNKYRLPFEICYNSSAVFPFWIQMIEEMAVEKIPTGGILLSFDNRINSVDWHYLKATENIKNVITATSSPNWSTNIVNCIDNCWTDKVLFEWVGRFGVLKSWWFTTEKYTYGTEKELNLQTMENGYNTLKNKRTNLVVKHQRADLLTQQYLSDIVLSDEVYIYDGTTVADKLRVKIDNNSFDVSKKKRDISLTVNKFAYDTI